MSAGPSRAAGFALPTYRTIGIYHGITEYELVKNGLKVLYRYDPTTPVVGLMVTYLVGSRHEATGYTGATHLLEHLMFKGSKHFPKEDGVSVLDRLSEKGALVNATTWLDRTNYYEVLPDEHFEFALKLEADRMRNALITRGDLDEEMPAVRSEYAMGENDPLETLDKHLWAAAYVAHPYHHSTIGWLSDIENVPIERLQSFYDTYYWPNNAYVTVIGNCDPERTAALLEEHFGVHPKAPATMPEPYTKEPPQLGVRTVEVARAGTMDVVGLAYKVPEALHADTPTLTALSLILADGKTSRLYRALVEKGLASSVGITYTPFRDPSLFPIYASPVEGVSHERIERAIHAELHKVATDGIESDELRRALTKIESAMAFSRDGHYAMLAALNESIAVGDWRYYFDLPEKIRNVRVKDIQAVARRYFVNEGLTLGRYRALRTP